MRALLVASLLAFFAFPTYAQEPTDDRPIIIRQAPLDSGDVDPLVQEENPLKYMKFKERILVGGGIGGLQFGNPTVISLAPQVGYQLTMNAIAGFSGSYTYQSYKLYNSSGGTFRQSFSLMSVGAFGRHNLSFLPEQLRNIYVQAEVEQHFGLNFETNFKPAYLIGAGIDLGGLQITALYNPNYEDPRSFYSNPLVLRVGGFFIRPKF